MKEKRKVIQLSLVLVGLCLIFATYFFYPKIKQNNLITKKPIEKQEEIGGIIDYDLKNLPDKVFEKKYRKSKKQLKKEIKITTKANDDLENLPDKAFQKKYGKTKKEFKEEKKVKEEKRIAEIRDNLINTFDFVEYKGLYDYDKPFIVTSEKAHIINDNPDIVYMTKMKVTMYMKDGRIIIITSDQGRYDKLNYNCFFEYNVKATDGETTMLSENLDLLATSETASVYNNVILTGEQGSLKADQINYDFNNENYQISMFNEGKVKIKIIK